MEVDRLPRLGLERCVQVEAVLEQVHQVVARDELRAEACRVPGRAARELVLLDERDLVPPEPRQVIEDAAARYSSADDDGFRCVTQRLHPPRLV
jgi:hypothetical protein